ncbi:MAG TPA: sugar ABC transporter substrate-binding protein [Gemmatimonadaceae bacterium]|nr:sugar ABC transporter substrate-binding protein [Gemmatimonadaceae bacterium]
MLALVACTPASAERETTVRFWAMGREGEVVAELIPEFERRNPGVRVRVQQIPWTAAHEKLVTAVVGDATPDVAQLGNTWVPEFQALDAIEPLDARVAASALVPRDDFFSGIWDTNVIDGVTYGIPWYVDTRILFYRSDLLAAAGVRTPIRSWEAWKDGMRAVQRSGGARWGILLPTNEYTPPIVIALQTGAQLVRDGGRAGAFRDPEFRRAFEFYISLYRDGLAPTISSTQVANIFQQFADGEFAMYITGPWNVGEFDRRLPASMRGRWATMPLPAPDGNFPGISSAGGSSLVLFKESRHQAEAWRLIEFLSEPAQQLRFARLTGDLPARRSAWQDSALIGDARLRSFYEQLQHVRPTPPIPEWEQISTKIMEYVEAAARGRLTTDRAVAALDADVDRMLQKRRWLLDRRARTAPAAGGAR